MYHFPLVQNSLVKGIWNMHLKYFAAENMKFSVAPGFSKPSCIALGNNLIFFSVSIHRCPINEYVVIIIFLAIFSSKEKEERDC